MSATDYDFPRKVAAIVRNGWPPWFGITGRHAPDYASWLETRKVAIRSKTAHQYQSIIQKHIFPTFSNVMIKDLTLVRTEKYYSNLLEAGVGIRTIHIVHNILHSSLEKAVKYGYISRNPTQGATLPVYRFDEMQVLSLDQVAKFLSAASRSSSYALYHLAIVTGMRMGELLGLKWPDIDWEMGLISVRRQRQYVPGEGITLIEPKTKAGKRTIKLGKNSLEILQKHFHDQSISKNRSKSKWMEMDLVFPNSVGKPDDASNIRLEFNKILDSAGIPRIRFHDLRHTAAAIFLNHNVPVIVVSHILGHSKPSVTLDLYGHVMSDMQEEAAAIMEKLVSPISVKNPSAE